MTTTTQKITANIGAIQKTLLIPLYARYLISKKKPQTFYDAEALQMVPLIDYDFTKFDKAIGSMNGSVVRTLHYDKLVQNFIKNNPEGSIIEMGSGLNNRFKRLDNGQIHWLDFDLADVMAFKAKLDAALQKNTAQPQPQLEQPNPTRYQSIAANIAKPETWQTYVNQLPKPWCFVSEAAIIYLDNPKVKTILAGLSDMVKNSHTGVLAGKARLIMDTCAEGMVNNQNKHDTLRHMPKASWIRYCCNNPETVETYGEFKLLSAEDFLDLDVSSFKAFSLPWYIMCRYFSCLIRKPMSWYKMCVYQIG